MKTRISLWGKGSYELLVADGTKGESRKVLASMVLFEGTGCWMLTDIRLHGGRKPSAYSGSLYADDIDCCFNPKTKDEAEFVKGLLREFTVQEDGSIHWSSFEGLVRGKLRPCSFSSSYHNGIGYFTRAEGLAYLKKLQEFWAAYSGDPADAKIDNPNRQPSSSAVFWQLRLREPAVD